MNTIILYFKDHAPVRYTGDWQRCALQVANARLYPGFVSWELVGGC